MNYKETIGIVLVFLGLFLMIIQPISPTGAVIDLSTSSARLSFFVGILMVIGGIILVLASRTAVESGLERGVKKNFFLQMKKGNYQEKEFPIDQLVMRL